MTKKHVSSQSAPATSPLPPLVLSLLRCAWGASFTPKLRALLDLVALLQLDPDDGQPARREVYDGERLTLCLDYRLPVALILEIADACGVTPGRPRSVGEALDEVARAFDCPFSCYNACTGLTSFWVEDDASGIYLSPAYRL